jgi:hypothetical protein
MDRCNQEIPCAFSPPVTVDQKGEFRIEPAPVTSNVRRPHLRAMAGNFAREPEPNSMRGKREMVKLVMRTVSFHSTDYVEW